MFCMGGINKQQQNARALGEPLGGPGRGQLGRPWESLCEGLEELWEVLYIDKLPINRPSGRYVIT